MMRNFKSGTNQLPVAAASPSPNRGGGRHRANADKPQRGRKRALLGPVAGGERPDSAEPALGALRRRRQSKPPQSYRPVEFRAPLAVLSAPGTLTATLIGKLKVAALKAELNARGLPVDGLKAALGARLLSYVNERS